MTAPYTEKPMYCESLSAGIFTCLVSHAIYTPTTSKRPLKAYSTPSQLFVCKLWQTSTLMTKLREKLMFLHRSEREEIAFCGTGNWNFICFSRLLWMVIKREKLLKSCKKRKQSCFWLLFISQLPPLYFILRFPSISFPLTRRFWFWEQTAVPRRCWKCNKLSHMHICIM